MNHLCHAIKCDHSCSPAQLMCRKHWKMVPETLQLNVWKTYRKGQEIDKKPTEAYIRAQLAAINHVAASEGYQLVDVEKRVCFLRSKGLLMSETGESGR